METFVWLAKLVRWGNFTRIAEPLYYRLGHAHNYHKEWQHWPEDRKRAAWTTMFTGLLEAVIPLCRTPEERLFFQQMVFDRIVVYPSYLYRPSNEPNSPRKLIAACLERLRHEGNTHLLSVGELPPILQELQSRLDEIKLLERSRMRRVIYGIRQRSRMGRVIYPRSGMRRVIYQIRHLVEELEQIPIIWTRSRHV
jgi:hypothetical protein